MPWNPGDHITLRWTGHFDGHEPDKPGILQGWPHIVVEDRDDLLALWMPGGTRTHHVDLADRNNEIEAGVWRIDTLRLLFPGKPYSIALSWATPQDPSWPVQNPVAAYYDRQREARVARGEEAPRDPARPSEQERQREHERTEGAPHEFRGWYVNLEAPFVRTPIGILSSDNSLDAIVRPDLTWYWKDEETMPRWIERGVFTREHVDRFYREGREAIADAEARRFPFDGAYLDWLPEPHWGLPQVHPEWDRLPGYDMSHAIGRRLPWTDPPRRQRG